jgi:excisionase family DNA binding protein
MKDKYLSVQEASEILTLAKSTLYQYIHNRYIPYTKVGGRIVFEEKIIRKWMNRKRKEVIRK